MALIAGGKCEDMQRQIDYEKARYSGDIRALQEELSKLRRSNRALKGWAVVEKHKADLIAASMRPTQQQPNSARISGTDSVPRRA
jgi:hypothetical protein